MNLAADLAALLPPRDLNGDTIVPVERHQILLMLWGLIEPVKHRFGITDTDPPTLETFLDMWWPRHMDGACLAWRARDAAARPYPDRSIFRSAGITLSLEPDLVFSSVRFGFLAPTTTRIRALWDIGIRRQVWHVQVGPAYEWLIRKGITARLMPMPPDDPYAVWSYRPSEPPRRRDHPFYLDMSDRPKTDNLMDWLRGAL